MLGNPYPGLSELRTQESMSDTALPVLALLIFITWDVLFQKTRGTSTFIIEATGPPSHALRNGGVTLQRCSAAKENSQCNLRRAVTLEASHIGPLAFMFWLYSSCGS